MKKLTALLTALITILALAGCGRKSMDCIIENEPSIIGIVEEICDNAILVKNENEEYLVSLNAQNKDSTTHFSIGDEVVIYYDGSITESYPMQISTVYAITLRTPADRRADSQGQSEVSKHLSDKFDMEFRLYGPEGQDQYVFYIYPDHAEHKCYILMPENTDDIAEHYRDLSWKIVDDELIITGQWQGSFKIDITAETATDTATGKVYSICEMQ